MPDIYLEDDIDGRVLVVGVESGQTNAVAAGVGHGHPLSLEAATGSRFSGGGGGGREGAHNDAGVLCCLQREKTYIPNLPCCIYIQYTYSRTLLI